MWRYEVMSGKLTEGEGGGGAYGLAVKRSVSKNYHTVYLHATCYNLPVSGSSRRSLSRGKAGLRASGNCENKHGLVYLQIHVHN